MNWQLTVPLAVALVTSVACTRRDDARPGDASTTAADVPAHRVGASAASRPIAAASSPAADAAEEISPAPKPATPPPPATGTPAPAEAPLPSWVPESGRLTVVQA